MRLRIGTGYPEFNGLPLCDSEKMVYNENPLTASVVPAERSSPLGIPSRLETLPKDHLVTRRISFVRVMLMALICVSMTPSPLLAHPGHSVPGNGMVAGLLHPLLGWDHLLAMLMVGLLSTQFRGPALWAVPGSFVAAMIAGGLLGMRGWGLPAIEPGIAVSVLVLGLAVALDRRTGIALPLALAGLFGFVHGQAHGLEMPRIDSPALYACGFVLATIVLHAVGVLAGIHARKSLTGARGLRLSGSVVAIAGCWLLFAV